MNCPACHVALIVVEHEGIEIDWCLECRGLWFDEGELELLGEKCGRRLRAGEMGDGPGVEVKSGERKCLRCRQRMQQLQLGPDGEATIEVDRCKTHGFWLDRGELGGVMRRLQSVPGTDEGVMLRFLGETFDVNASPTEGSE